MNSLQQAVAARRAVENGASAAAVPQDAAPRTLRVEPKGAECWLLAWSQFVSAQHTSVAGGETLVLRFSEHEVAISGHRLSRLLPEIAELHLDCLRCDLRPEAAAAKATPEPVIAQITVRPLSRAEPYGKASSSGS